MNNCIFEPTNLTSSATICKHCGQDKIVHNHNLQVFDVNNIRIDDVDRIIELSEKRRTFLNNLGSVCSGEVEEHIFDVGFYEGYKSKESELLRCEISDEEIEKVSEEKYNYKYSTELKGMIISAQKGAWMDAIKWYRERLKQRP